MTTTENSRDALTDEQIINIAEKHHASHPGVDEWWAFRDRADVIAFGRAILAAAPVEKPAAAPIPIPARAITRASVITRRRSLSINWPRHFKAHAHRNLAAGTQPAQAK